MPNGEVLVGSLQLAIGSGTITVFSAGGSATAGYGVSVSMPLPSLVAILTLRRAPTLNCWSR